MKNFEYLDSKNADYCYTRGEDFHLGFVLGDEVLSIEYIPANWPAVTVSRKKKEEYSEVVDTLEELGFERNSGF